MSRSRYFTYTTFVPISEFTDFTKKLHKDERFFIAGYETCPKTSKKHFQCYIQFNNPCSWQQALKRVPKGSHVEFAFGSVEDNIKYCSKESVFISRGTPKTQGQRTDLEGIMEQIKNGKSNLEICESSPETYERYLRFIKHYRELLDLEKQKQALDTYKAENVVLNPFQEQIVSTLDKQTEREVLWISDPKGGSGKTFLSKVLLASHNAFRCTNGKTKDIAYAYCGEPVFIMDLSRSLEDRVNYDIIEQIKNGLVFSGKYESKHKVFKTPKMLILANFEPDYSKLSKDRWQAFTGNTNTVQAIGDPNEYKHDSSLRSH